MSRDPLDRAANVGALLVLLALAVVLCVAPSWPVAACAVVALVAVVALRALAQRDLGAEVDALRAVAEESKKTAQKALEVAHAARKPSGPGF